ncbi:hypothetical protein [Burkholderia pseudomallei]|uniref:hypothetical protein n=1 Tax=Burkholderia pseudomallei TaxID=28450 RepID=UPI000F045C7A|nr:hypothetical protein [Burkholderia pseudomallei]
MPSSAERAARLDARVVAATTHVGERRDRARRAAPAFGANQTSANKTGGAPMSFVKHYRRLWVGKWCRRAAWRTARRSDAAPAR